MGTGRKLLIVGDSFVAQDNDEHHEWAWWNRLAEDTKCEPVNLAITGASNFNIWHQLKYGYKNYNVKNKLVVLTAQNRIENINKPINKVKNSIHKNYFNLIDYIMIGNFDFLKAGFLVTF